MRPEKGQFSSRPEIRIRLAKPALGYEESVAIKKVLESGVLTNGPRTAEFENLFAARHDVDNAVAFANGTVALAAMFLALRIGPGDEVIVPSLTFISSATSVLHVGAKPVFADVDPITFNLNPRSAASAMTSRTKAILAVHYGGQPADMDELRSVADRAGIALLEDAAEAHGARYKGKSVGSLGDAAMFSFTPTKNITTGEGGMVTTNDGALARQLRLLRNHGQVSPYHHVLVGYNWRITELQAAMGIVQLGKLDEILVRKRRNAEWMRERLGSIANVRSPAEMPDREHVYMLFTLLVNRRDYVLDRLLAAGIEARVYFPPVHRQPIFSGGVWRLPVTDAVSRRMLSIPFHSLLTPEELEEIACALEEATLQTRQLSFLRNS
jgi:perosamine synthetase